MRHRSREGSDAGERAGMLEAERQEKLAQLVLRRSKLSPEEVAFLREVFPAIVAQHHDLVWNLLRRRGLDGPEAEDLYQEVFLALHRHIAEHGFPDDIPETLRGLVRGKVSNHVRGRRRSPLSIGLPRRAPRNRRARPTSSAPCTTSRRRSGSSPSSRRSIGR